MRHGHAGAKRRGRRGRKEPARPPPPVHELTIPDELVAWGKDPARARSWAAPWGHEVEKMLKLGAEKVLNGRETEALLSRLEALCIEAIRAGQDALLVGIDLFTADWLGLRYTFETKDGPVTLGKDVSYAELHTMIESGVDQEGVAFALACKRLVTDAFPQAQIGAIIDAKEAAAEACFGCGTTDAMVMLSMETGSQYCAPCWEELTKRWPTLEDLGMAKGKRKKRS